MDRVNERVTGTIGLKLYKGHARVVTRSSPNAVYDAALASFSESGGLFSQTASPGFIELFSLQSRMAWRLHNENAVRGVGVAGATTRPGATGCSACSRGAGPGRRGATAGSACSPGAARAGTCAAGAWPLRLAFAAAVAAGGRAARRAAAAARPLSASSRAQSGLAMTAVSVRIVARSSALIAAANSSTLRAGPVTVKAAWLLSRWGCSTISQLTPELPRPLARATARIPRAPSARASTT